MKKIGLVFNLVLFFSVSFQINAQWYNANNIQGYNNTNFLAVDFIDSINGWISAKDGLIFHTTNSGLGWIRQESNTTVHLRKIRFADINNGWAVGDSGRVIRTTNGGNSWDIKYSNAEWMLWHLYTTDSSHAFVAGNLGGYNGNNLFIKTTNGGNEWDTIDVSFLSEYGRIQSIFFINNNIGWFSYVDDNPQWFGGGIYKTINSGVIWTRQISNTNQYYKLSFIDENRGWCASTKSIYKTTNGANWSEIIVPNRYLQFIDFMDTNNGWSVQYSPGAPNSQIILCSIDGGNNWSEQISTDKGIQDILIMENGIGWAVGLSGLILKTINGGGIFTDIEEENNFSQPEQFLLQQNYPNPFNPSTKISWQSPVGSWQTLKVYDLIGNEVATLVNEYRNAGNYEVDFQSTVGSHQLANGVYFYQLRVGDFVETKKMILLK